MVQTISLDPKILVLKAEYEEELTEIVDFISKKRTEKDDLEERNVILQNLVGALKGSPDRDKKEIRRERLKERYGIDVGID